MKKSTLILFAAALLGVVVWQLRPSRKAVEEMPAAPDKPKSPTAPTKRQSAVISAPAKQRVERQAEKPAAAEAQEPPAMDTAQAEILKRFIPDWLLEQGEVRQERIQINGGWVERMRGRYAWPDQGGSVEVEVSDLGTNATQERFKSLGFDFEMEAEESEEFLRAFEDGKDYLANLEYSVEDGEGQVQYLVAGRYLMEVQLEGLPFESFQIMENRDRLFGALLTYATQTR